MYVFGNTLHQQEYQVMKKALDSGLSKQQISNVFKNQKEFEKILAIKLENMAIVGPFFTHFGWDSEQNLNFNDIKDSLNGLNHISRGILVNR